MNCQKLTLRGLGKIVLEASTIPLFWFLSNPEQSLCANLFVFYVASNKIKWRF